MRHLLAIIASMLMLVSAGITPALAFGLPEPGETPEVTLLVSENRVAIMLSDDLSSLLDTQSRYCLDKAIGSPFEGGLLYDIMPCGEPGQPCLGASRLLCDLCGTLMAAGRYGDFLLYRQVGDAPFEEVGFISGDLACVVSMQQGHPVSHISSPPLYLVSFTPTALLPKWPETLHLQGTLRLVWADPRPLGKEEKVRYRILTFDDKGNPGQIHTSHWLFPSGL